MPAPITPELAEKFLSTPLPDPATQPAKQAQPAQASLVDENQPKRITPENADAFLRDIPKAETNQPSAIGDVLRGIDNLQEMGGGLTSLAGNMLGLKGVEDWGMEVRNRNEVQARENPAAIGSFDNIHGVGDALIYAREAVLENLPMFVPSMATGGIGGIVARKTAQTVVNSMIAELVSGGMAQAAAEEAAVKMVAKRVFIGSSLGAYGGSAGMETGSIYSDVVSQTGVKDPQAALEYGAVAGVLDALPEGRLLTTVLGPKVAETVVKGLFKRMGEEAGKQFLSEAPTELIQTIIEEAAIVHADPTQDLWSSERLKSYADAGLKGGLAGGVMGAGGGIIHTDPVVKMKVEEINAAADKLTPNPTTSEVVTEEDRRISAIQENLSTLEEEQKAAAPDRVEAIKAEKAKLNNELATLEQSLVDESQSEGPKFTENADGTFASEFSDPEEAQKWVDDNKDSLASHTLITADGKTALQFRPTPQAMDAFKRSVAPEEEEADKKDEALVDEKKNSEPIDVIHFSRLPNFTPSKTEDIANMPGKYEEESTFGRGLYTAEPADEQFWKDADRLDLGKHRSELTVSPKNPIIISPETIESLSVDQIQKDIKDGKADAVIVRGFGAELDKNRDELAAKIKEQFTPKFKDGATSGSFTNGAELDELMQKLVPEVMGFSADKLKEFDKVNYLQNQVFIPQHASDSVKVNKTVDAKREPTHQFKPSNLPPGLTPKAVKDTHAKIHASIDSLVDEKDDVAKGQVYTDALKSALDPYMNFFAGAKVLVKKGTGTFRVDGNGARSRVRPTFLVAPSADGAITIQIPSFREWNERNARANKSGAATRSIESIPKIIEEEVIHSAHYSMLRDKWNKSKSKSSFIDYVDKNMRQVGKWLMNARESMADELKAIYPIAKDAGQEGVEFTVGTEFIRQMVQRARTGQLTEDFHIQDRIQRGGIITEMMKVMLKAAEQIHDAIKKFLNPETSTPSIQKVYQQVSDVLDTYGVVRPNPTPMLEEKAETPTHGDEENKLPEKSENDAQAAQELHAQKVGERAAAKRKQKEEESLQGSKSQKEYKAALVAARKAIDAGGGAQELHDAAVMHAKVNMKWNKKLGTIASRAEARASFEIALQREVTQEQYDKAVADARPAPVAAPAPAKKKARVSMPETLVDESPVARDTAPPENVEPEVARPVEVVQEEVRAESEALTEIATVPASELAAATVENVERVAPALTRYAQIARRSASSFSAFSASLVRSFGNKVRSIARVLWDKVNFIIAAAMILNVANSHEGIQSHETPHGNIAEITEEHVAPLVEEMPASDAKAVEIALTDPDTMVSEEDASEAQQATPSESFTSAPSTQVETITAPAPETNLSAFMAEALEVAADRGEAPGSEVDDTNNYSEQVNAAREKQAEGRRLSPMEVAWTFYGEREGKNAAIQRILDMFASRLSQDEYAWCAPFMSYTMAKAGLKQRSQASREFLNFGTGVSLASAHEGDIAVMWNDNPKTGGRHGYGGHVAYIVKTEGDFTYILGGNQHDSVNVSVVHNSRILGVRRMESIQKTEDGKGISYHSDEMENMDTEAMNRLDSVFNPMALVNETERRKRLGSRLKFWNYSSQEMEYMSQPKDPTFFAAGDAIRELGGITRSAEWLLRNELAEGLGLVGGEKSALYARVIMGLEAMNEAAQDDESFLDAEEVDWIDQTLDALDTQFARVNLDLGRWLSNTKGFERFMTGRTARKDYSKAIMQRFKKVFGEKGSDFLDILSVKLNKVSNDFIDKVVTRPEAIAFFRKVLKDINTKSWRKEFRKTLVNESDKIKKIARKIASRAAEMAFGDMSSEPALKEAMERILSSMTFGIPKTGDPVAAQTVLSAAIAEVTRQVARDTGIIPEPEKKQKTSELQKLSQILQNDDLYNQFLMNLEERMVTKFGGNDAAQNFHESMNAFMSQMADKQWMHGLVEGVIREKLAKMEVSIAKVAKQTYGAGVDLASTIRQALVDELKADGVEDEDVISQIAEDLDATLNKSIEDAREKWAGSPGAVRKSLREIGETMASVAKAGYADRGKFAQRMAQRFITDLGLANSENMPHADRLVEILTEQMDAMVGKEREAIIKRTIDSASPEFKAAMLNRKGKNKSGIEKVIQLANMGALRREDVYNAVADKLGLPEFNERDADFIQDWGERIGNMPPGRERTIEIIKLRNWIGSRTGISWKDMLVAGMYSSMLSGPSTQAVNVVSNALNLMGELWTQSALSVLPTSLGGYGDPGRVASLFRGMFTALTRGGRLEFMQTITTGLDAGKLNQKIEGGNPLEFQDPHYLDPVGKAVGKVLSLTRAKYVVRLLQATDMMFYKAAQEVSFIGKTGYSGKLDQWAVNVTEARAAMVAQGRVVDTREGQRNVELLALQNMERKRVEGNSAYQIAWDEAHGEALTTTFNNEPKGWIGSIALLISKFTNEYKVGKLLIPFSRVVANVLNTQIEWSPFGIARWAFSQDFKIESADGEMIRDKKILVRSLTSMVVLGALSAMLARYDDDDDPYFTIYGSGPKDANKKRQLYERGWKPNTIKVGGSYFSYLPTPMSLAFSALGTLMDRRRDDPNIEALDYAPQLAMAFVQGTLNQSFLTGVADLFSAFESSNPEQKVQRFLARTSTIIVPNLFKQIDAWYDPSVQQSSSFMDMVIKQIPVARQMSDLKPMLNVFGQPVNRTQGPLGIPFLNRFVTTEKEGDPVYSFIAQHALSVSSYSRQTNLGDKRMTEDEFYEYVKKSGPMVYDAIRREIPSMRNLTKEKMQDRMDDISTRIKRSVRDGMKSSRRRE